MTNKALFYCLLIFTLLQGCKSISKKESAGSLSSLLKDTISPAIVTEPSLNDTDDPAIWVNPYDPSQSLVLATDKGDENGGIYVYHLDGKIDRSRTILNLKRPNNIDVEYGFSYGNKTIDIAVFTERGRNMIRVLSLPDLKFIDNGGIEVFTGEKDRDPMGIALYKEPAGNIYAIVSRKTGPTGTYLWQYLLQTQHNGVVTGKKARMFGVFSGKKEIEAIVADDNAGYIYYSDETTGVRQYYAHPDSSNRELSLFATTGIVSDHEGISICPTGDTTGYILLSDQQANRFRIYERQGREHKLIRTVYVTARESDGSDLVTTPLNQTFSHGIFVVMSTDKTFHFYRLEDVVRL